MGYDTGKLIKARDAAQAQMNVAATALAAVEDLRGQDGQLPPPWDTFRERIVQTENASRQARDWAEQQLRRQ